jgi:hypothetical protein
VFGSAGGAIGDSDDVGTSVCVVSRTSVVPGTLEVSGTVVAAGLRGLVLELFAELTCHGASTTHPSPDLADHFGELFRTEHE